MNADRIEYAHTLQLVLTYSKCKYDSWVININQYDGFSLFTYQSHVKI